MNTNKTYLALAQSELKGLVAVQARVELAPVLVEGPRVVHRQLVALLGLDVAVLGAELDADALCVGGRIVGKGRRVVSGGTSSRARTPSFHSSTPPLQSRNALTHSSPRPHIPASPRGPGQHRRPAWQTRSGPRGQRRS